MLKPVDINTTSDCINHSLKLQIPIKNDYTIFFWAKLNHIRGKKSYTIARLIKNQKDVANLKLSADPSSNIKWNLHFEPGSSSDYFFHKVTQKAINPYTDKWFYVQMKLNDEKSSML